MELITDIKCVSVKKLEAELSQLQSEVAKAAACAENIAKRDTFLTVRVRGLRVFSLALKTRRSPTPVSQNCAELF